MGMMETKVVQVENTPESINRTGEIWGCFGWNVTSVQVTHSQNTKTVTEGLGWYTGTNTVKTTTINYATVTMQRDKDIPNHAELVKCQAEFETIINAMEAEEVPKSGNSGCLIFCGIMGFFGLGACLEHPFIGMIMMAGAVLVPFILKAADKEGARTELKGIRERNQERSAKADEILEKASSLLNA